MESAAGGRFEHATGEEGAGEEEGEGDDDEDDDDGTR